MQVTGYITFYINGNFQNCAFSNVKCFMPDLNFSKIAGIKTCK